MDETPLGGWCAPGWEVVRDAFATNLAERGEVGAAVHVVERGEVVVDLHGGWADDAGTRPWEPDSLVDVYSVGKGPLAALVLQLVEDGTLALDQPIAEVWPEFGTGGKASATIEHALTHRAGVPAIRQVLTDVDLLDWPTMTAALAATEAWYPPGERLTYHTNTYGHLVGEIIHRVTGQMPGESLRGRLGDPLDADVWFGVPPGEQHRIAELIWAPGLRIPTLTTFDGLGGDVLMSAMSQLNPPGYSSIGLVNTPAWRALPLGSTAGHASARGVARVYAALLEPDRILGEALRAEAARPRATGHCPILGDEVTFGLGFQPTTARRPLGPNAGTFGHFGSGGALGFADPTAGIAFGYVMNHLVPRWQSSRNRALIEATYAAAGRTG